MARPSSNMADFGNILTKTKHVVTLSGAGVGAERCRQLPEKWQARAWSPNPSRCGSSTRRSRRARLAGPRGQGWQVMAITRDINGPPRTKNLLESHGSIFNTQPRMTGVRLSSFIGKGAAEPESKGARISRWQEAGVEPCCGHTWGWEDTQVQLSWIRWTESPPCVTYASVVYPGSTWEVAVAHLLPTEATPATGRFGFQVRGPWGTTLPGALAPPDTERLFQLSRRGKNRWCPYPLGPKQRRKDPAGGERNMRRSQKIL
ncbi:NAD-dependent protein deacylase sirtuin-5, mitochondrial-like [Echinops telfairi]|uniref:NAD-dependent protein deacylase sirtuin-5, mitochondrial-like n=1 Tax=Echinops telfairi TaxID=9371 RepID=A0ABM0ZPU3_ECHTE|nr:NAD-dependent protein deacylase sirtuin-5, mitochondrial-like [Echinops telfairi]